MMKKVFTAIGHAVSFTKKGDPIKEGFSPYSDKACNAIYNLLLSWFRYEKRSHVVTHVMLINEHAKHNQKSSLS